MESQPDGVLSTYRVDVDGLDIAVHDAGVGSQSILAIHGFGSDGLSSYETVAAPLREAGFRIVAPDLPGFGLSRRPSPELGMSPYSLSFFAKHVAAVVDAANLSTCVVAGHSMGAKIALTLALDYPEKVEKLILINPGGFSGRERLLPLFGHLGVWYKVLASSRGRRLGRAVGLGAFLSSKRTIDQVRDFRHAHRAMDLRHSRTLARLNELRVPTLLLWGVNDRLLPRTVPGRVARRLPQTAVHFVGSAGHAPMVAQPDVVAAAIKAFVSLPAA